MYSVILMATVYILCPLSKAFTIDIFTVLLPSQSFFSVFYSPYFKSANISTSYRAR